MPNIFIGRDIVPVEMFSFLLNSHRMNKTIIISATDKTYQYIDKFTVYSLLLLWDQFLFSQTKQKM